MDLFYAQIDDAGICFSIQTSPELIDNSRLIPIAFFDDSLMGKLWNGNMWIDAQPPAPELPPISNEDLIHATMYNVAMIDVILHNGGFFPKEAVPMAVMAFESENHLEYYEPVSTQSPTYDFWRHKYFANHADAYTLQELAYGGVLRQTEVDTIIADRITKFGQ